MITPVASRSSGWTGHSPSKGPTMCSPPSSWPRCRRPIWSWPPTWPSPSPATRCNSPTRRTISKLLSKGRFTLGLGSQIRAQVEKRYGASFDRPIARMRELVGALRAIFATWESGDQLDFRGEFTSHTLMPPTFNPGPHPFGMPPIAIGGLGPQMVRLAAEVADGLLVMPFNTARHFRQRTVPAIGEGLARAGRSRTELTVTGEVIVCCGTHRGGDRGRPARRPVAPLVLCIHARLPAGARGGGMGGSATGAQ